MFDYEERRRRLGERLREEGIDLLFLPLSSDLEYLTGLERSLPSFGQASQAHDWVSGAFVRPDGEPIFLLTRMEVVFDVQVTPPVSKSPPTMPATGLAPITRAVTLRPSAWKKPC